MVPKRVSIYHPLGFNWRLLEGAGMYVRSLFCEIHFGCHLRYVSSAHMLHVWYCTVCIYVRLPSRSTTFMYPEGPCMSYLPTFS